MRGNKFYPMAGFSKGISLVFKYTVAAGMVFALWGMLEFWTHGSLDISYSPFYSRDMSEKTTLGWVNEMGRSSLEGQDNANSSCSELQGSYPSPKRFVLFNVLPKSGSRTLNSVAINVVTKQGVNVENTMALTNETKLEKMERLLNETTTAQFVYSHLPFIELNGTDRKVVYISVVRDPIDRLVSLYYYKRYGDSTEPGYFRAKMDQLNLSKDTFDECVRKKGDCISNNLFHKTIQHFCGISPGKAYPSHDVCLTMSKKNIRNKYLVVGVMDDYLGFVKVLERLLPDFFEGAVSFYEQFVKLSYFDVMKTKNKTGPSDKIRNQLRSKMAKDYELYEFVKREFDTLKRKLGID